jgi:uncharacterized membrane-anchored protein YitT (DUF2179 family)
MLLLGKPTAERHSVVEDAQGLIIGTTLMALSVQFLRAAELFTGQIAGLSLIGSYATGWSFGAIFFALNLPFYLLAIRQVGWAFTIRTLIAVALVSALVDGMPVFFTLPPLPPAVGAILFGVLAGAGVAGDAFPAWRDAGRVSGSWRCGCRTERAFRPGARS